MSITVFVSLLFLFLFSVYKTQGIIDTLSLLSKSFNIKFIALASFITIVILFIYTKLKKIIAVSNPGFNKIPKYIFIALGVFFFLINASYKFTEMYGIVPIEQLIFHLSLPTSGANFSMVQYFVIEPLIATALMLVFSFYPLSIAIDYRERRIIIPFINRKRLFVSIAVLLPIAGVLFLFFSIGLPQYIISLKEEPSTFYEDNYIYPENIEITFPDRKRNLIVIFVESLETGFLTEENGGAFTEDLIPEIVSLAGDNINFSINEGIGGPIQLYGTEWTIAGIAAYYSGVPLAVSFLNQTARQEYGSLGNEFLPEASGIGDILDEAGYKSYFILGSNIEFGGRDKYFKTHKNTVIYDYRYFHDNHFIPDDYKVWWGIEDRKLYQFAKDIISEVTAEEPFFITLLTADTHPYGGYLDDQAEKIFDSRYKNVLRDMSKQLYAFMNWLEQQEFYENTTVVILGDHLYQDSLFFPEKFRIKDLASRYEKEILPENNIETYNRYPINIFINSVLNPNEVKHRKFSHFDMLPILIESIGGAFDSEGLAIGRSINGTNGNASLLNKYGEAAMNMQLKRKSALYNSLWGAKK
jgi:phosphoglycerol transferase